MPETSIRYFTRFCTWPYFFNTHLISDIDKEAVLQSYNHDNPLPYGRLSFFVSGLKSCASDGLFILFRIFSFSLKTVSNLQFPFCNFGDFCTLISLYYERPFKNIFWQNSTSLVIISTPHPTPSHATCLPLQIIHFRKGDIKIYTHTFKNLLPHFKAKVLKFHNAFLFWSLPHFKNVRKNLRRRSHSKTKQIHCI